jgi:DNA-3-methyladenine glycosylase II
MSSALVVSLFVKLHIFFFLSELFLSDSDFFENVDSYSNSDIISKLTSVKGIGLWTSQMFLIFNLCRLDVMPYDDVSIKNSVKINYNLSSIPSKSELETISAKWGKYSSVACWYLWRDIDF